MGRAARRAGQARRNDYVHKDTYVHWKGEEGAAAYECHADCSAFYTQLLHRAYGWDGAQFKKWLGAAHPTAHRWHDAIVEEKGFKRIKLVKDLRPGDVLAVKFPPGEDDTGHVMLVAGLPKPRAATEPLAPGTRQWEVEIIDSSKSGHGAGDTRHKPDNTYNKGVGRGTLRLYADEQGAIAGYSWSTSRKSDFRAMADRAIAAGRLEPDFKPDAKSAPK